jgi:hypothetical protein
MLNFKPLQVRYETPSLLFLVIFVTEIEPKIKELLNKLEYLASQKYVGGESSKRDCPRLLWSTNLVFVVGMMIRKK